MPMDPGEQSQAGGRRHALGDRHTGNTTTPAGTFPGGFLALASNSNSYSHDQFSTVPELGLDGFLRPDWPISGPPWAIA